MEPNFFQPKSKSLRTASSHILQPTRLIPRSQASLHQSDTGPEISQPLETENTLIEDEDSIYEIDPECIRCRKHPFP